MYVLFHMMQQLAKTNPHFDQLSSAQKSRLLEIFLAGIGESLHDVVPNGAGKKYRLLRDCLAICWRGMGLLPSKFWPFEKLMLIPKVLGATHHFGHVPP